MAEKLIEKKKNKRRKIRTGSTKAPLLISNASLPKISYGETLKVEREKKKRKRKRRIVRVEEGNRLWTILLLGGGDQVGGRAKGDENCISWVRSRDTKQRIAVK